MPRRIPVQADDVYNLRMPMRCRLDRSGSRLLFEVAQASKKKLRYETHLWSVRTDGEASLATQFTFGRESESNPKWSPDGSQIAFLSNRSGRREIWIMPSDGGEARQVTELGGSVSDFDWHPKGHRFVIAFTPESPEAKARKKAKKRAEPEADTVKVRAIDRLVYKVDGGGFLSSSRTHVWLVDAKTGKGRQLLDDDRYDESEPRFSPDGKWIYFSSNRSDDPDLQLQRVDIWRMSATARAKSAKGRGSRTGGGIDLVKTLPGPVESQVVSPDGEWVVFTGSPDPDGPWN